VELKPILVAGIGNIFLGDDGFGCEVIREWSKKALPAEVRAVDFGIRSYDLAYALAENYRAVILVDATPRGEPPGTAFLLELELNALGAAEDAAVDAHSLDPVKVLQMAKALGARPDLLFLVGCEPSDLGGEQGRMGLSAPVQAAVPRALEMLEALVQRLLSSETRDGSGAIASANCGVTPP
jgi:hydrogenase maturation protease